MTMGLSHVSSISFNLLKGQCRSSFRTPPTPPHPTLHEHTFLLVCLFPLSSACVNAAKIKQPALIFPSDVRRDLSKNGVDSLQESKSRNLRNRVRERQKENIKRQNNYLSPCTDDAFFLLGAEAQSNPDDNLSCFGFLIWDMSGPNKEQNSKPDKTAVFLSSEV